MRQGQQNRRGRGRNNNNNNNNRKTQNPLTRSFESNGPDVKIRGTPAHIAEKYISLARDAQSSGDPVLAENYLQHAEHYNRIIMSFREQTQGGESVGANGRPRSIDAYGDDYGDDEGDDFGSDMPIVQAGEPQPSLRSSDNGERHGQEQPPGPRHERQDRHERPERPRQDNRFGNEPRQGRDRNDRPERQDRPERAERPERLERSERADRPERIDRPERPVNGGTHAFEPERPHRAPEPRGDVPRRRERPRFGESSDQPDFLRRPVRRPRRDTPGDEPAAPALDQGVPAAFDDPKD
ncbi:MAG: DUF4167 domain-containing protein [Hyphomicrobiaceae bacterium]|nr:DUF4167 domain-containing protein [Hyphomicrobiaceae bacterium]